MSSLCCELHAQEAASCSWPRSFRASPCGVTLVCRGGRQTQQHPRNKGKNQVHITVTGNTERRQKRNRTRKHQTGAGGAPRDAGAKGHLSVCTGMFGDPRRSCDVHTYRFRTGSESILCDSPRCALLKVTVVLLQAPGVQ